jgi:hypothetical protein
MTTDIFNRLNELAEFKLEITQERIKRGLQECCGSKRKAAAARAYMVQKAHTDAPIISQPLSKEVSVPPEGIVK